MKQNIILLIVILFVSLITTRAQQPLIPIIEMKTRGLLGSVQNGKWIDAPKSASRTPNEIELVLVGLNGVEEGGVTLAKKGEKEGVCEDFQRFDFELKMDYGVAVSTAAKWNFTPRILRKIDVENRTYKSVVANFLARKGITRPVVKIRQAYRIDLDGDGVEEVLIAATNYKKGLSSSASAGDYSFVMVRAAKGRIVNDYLLKGDFVTRGIDFGAPTQNEISSVADLNGDGRMEIVLYGSYYEGEFASAFEFKNGKPVEIKEFKIDCGV